MARKQRRRPTAQRHAQTLTRLAVDSAQTATRSGEMMLASAQTIAHRSTMMMQALGNPAAMADPEFTRMAWEKVEAATKSGHAVAAQVNPLYDLWSAWMSRQTQVAVRGWFDLARSTSPAAALAAQSRYAEASLAITAAAGAKLAESAVRTGAAGLAPVHRAASANAKRLGRRR